jgi:predicted ArsR family transcriptional regulator
MASHPLSERFLEGTQGRLVRLLRAKPCTVEELAADLELTGNAVRLQLGALERDGLVRIEGRRPSGRKPAHVYALTSRADLLLSRAYVPVLQGLMDVLGARLTTAERSAVLKEVGRRLVAGAPRATGTRRERLLAAIRVLESLGGEAVLETGGRTTRLRGSGCPLGEVVQAHPEVCQIVETVVEQISGLKVEEQCERGERPRCNFRVE